MFAPGCTVELPDVFVTAMSALEHDAGGYTARASLLVTNPVLLTWVKLPVELMLNTPILPLRLAVKRSVPAWLVAIPVAIKPPMALNRPTSVSAPVGPIVKEAIAGVEFCKLLNTNLSPGLTNAMFEFPAPDVNGLPLTRVSAPFAAIDQASTAVVLAASPPYKKFVPQLKETPAIVPLPALAKGDPGTGDKEPPDSE